MKKIIVTLLLSSTIFAQEKGLINHNSGRDNNISNSYKKVALIIANADYNGSVYTNLPNTLNDAKEINKTIGTFEFDKILYGTNVNENEFEDLLDDFRKEITTNTLAIFYYSGHGSSYANYDYLIPAKEKIIFSSHINSKGIKVEQVLDAMRHNKSGFNLIILDACRNNPFAKGGGGLNHNAERGFYIAYAAGKNKTALAVHPDNAKHSLYSWELIKFLRDKEYIAKTPIGTLFSGVRENVYKASKQSVFPGIYSQAPGENKTYLYYKKQTPQDLEAEKQRLLVLKELSEKEKRLKKEILELKQKYEPVPQEKKISGKKSHPTSLFWQKNNDSIKRSYSEANLYCKNLSLDSFHNWRVPTLSELYSLVDVTKTNPSINQEYFNIKTNSSYWSSTKTEWDPKKAYFVYFNIAEKFESGLFAEYYVRCIRN